MKTLLTILFLGALLSGCAGTHDSGPVSREFYAGRFSPRKALDEPDSLLVVSYNIEYAKRAGDAVDELLADPRLKGVDVLLLQEMDAVQSEMMARSLEMDYVYAPAYIHTSSKRRYGTTILSRWPIIASRGLVLPHPNPFSNNHRRAVAADVQVGSRRVRLVSVHLSTIVIPLEDRLHQAQVLADSLGGVAGPMIIGGDFNTVTEEGRRGVRQLMRRSGFDQVRLPEGGTASARAVDMINYDLVLDHMYFRGLAPGPAGIEPDFTASDHHPIWCRFGWSD